MKFVFAHCPKTAGTSVARSLWRICGEIEIIHPSVVHIKEFPWNRLTEWMDIRFLSDLEKISPSSSITGHFMAWQLMQFLGSDVSRQYHWFTVLRDPVDWAISLYNFTYHLSRDPLAPHFGWTYQERFSDWIQTVEPNIQTAFAPEKTAAAALSFAREHKIDLVPLPSINGYMDSLYRRCGLPPLPTPNYMQTEAALRRSDLSNKDIEILRGHMSEDVKLYENVKERFIIEQNSKICNLVDNSPFTPISYNDLLKLGNGDPVYIYGSKLIGRVILNEILDIPNVNFAGFLDSYQSGSVGEHPIHHIEAILPAVLQKATIIIATKQYSGVMPKLTALGIKNIWDGYPFSYTTINKKTPHVSGHGDKSIFNYY